MDITLAWVAALVTAAEAIVIKLTSKSLIKSPWLFNVLWLGFAVPPIVALAYVQGGGWPTHWPYILATALCSAGFYALYTLAIYKIDVTTMTPLFAVRTVSSVVLGLTLLDETISALGLLLMVVIIGASPLASYDERLKLKALFQKHVLVALFAMVLLAFVGFFTNRSVAANGFATTILWQDILTLVLLLPTLRFVRFGREKFNRLSLVAFTLLGLCSFIYTATTTYAYARNLSLSSIIVSLPISMVLAYALSRRYPELLEKHPARVYAVRFTGAAIMVGGAIWLSLL